MRLLFTFLFFSVLTCSLVAQSMYSPAAIGELILEHSKQSLQPEDVQALRIDRQYQDAKTGVTYVYATQTLNDIPIFNAIVSIAISSDGNTVLVNGRFIPGLNDLKTKSESGSLTAEQAVRHAFRFGGHDPQTSLTIDLSRSKGDQRIYHSELLSDNGAKARPMYVVQNGVLQLTWDVSYFAKRDDDYWSMRIDAATGVLVDKTSYTVHCKFDGVEHRHEPALCATELHVEHQNQTAMSAGDGATYNVYQLPVESPLHGSRTLVVDPADSVASPFGWHDLNAVEGAETMITEGNNANVWIDRDGNYDKDRDIEGGAELLFDFEQDGLTEPVDYQDAATTNLFYMVNMMHDFTYNYGFDEPAGNFQYNNDGKGGEELDEVIALAQYNGNTGANLNNADFSTPDDGGNGTMRMFLWNTRNDISIFSVSEPSSVAGLYPSRTAAFGPTIDTIPFEGQVVLADDEVGIGTDACENIQNGNELAGKIAMIDRGDCEFGFKILNAENNGAIGAIICNNVSGLLSGQMGAGAVGNQVTIPSVFLSKEDCEILRVHAGSGLTVKFQVPADNGEPERVDGSLDNGIIAHEYGHGISNRLTGGPDNTNCLRGFIAGGREEGEQMGEGWSDFFGLVLTVEPGDKAEDARGIGNYALRNPVDGSGIRTYPYSRDMSINPVTYYDTYEASIPHGIGQVWCSMLWDMYWNFVDRYGWDPDFIHGDKGNNIAIQLVMDGMKMQPCNPGFVDGRDAILAADMMINNGANQDIIWEAFARRGLGQFASQGESNRVADGREDYSIPPQYIKSVKMTKWMTPNILKGENIVVQLDVRNDLTEVATNVSVTDQIPDGTTVDMSTLPANATVNGTEITIAIDELAIGEQLAITYELETPVTASKLILYDDFEAPDTDGARWVAYGIEGNNIFSWADDDALSGQHSWKLSNIGANHDQAIFSFFEANPEGAKPVLRFAHKYSTDAGNDGGIVEISTDELETTEDLGAYVFRNPYNNRIRLATFGSNIEAAFSGTSNDWEMSYVDLSDYLGTTPYFQFRFASDAFINSDYWVIDDFTLFDALTYNSEACLTYDGSTDMICSEADGWGTIVEPEEFSSTTNKEIETERIVVYPNPALDQVTIEAANINGHGQLTIRNIDGRLVMNRAIERMQDQSRLTFNVATWSPGVYMIELTNNQKTITKKFVKK